jgi:alkane 1-monooxygenase
MVAVLGVGIAPYLVIQAVVGFSLLEVVNYMEHYGMLRQKVGVGERERYERVDPSHSWNSNNIATNVLLYHLQRHSDHHANPTRRYQSLRDFEESPVLPTGYAGMIVLAVVPAIWRRVMDPRVCAHFGGDMSRANITPRKRERILARYAVGGAAADSEEPSGLVRRVGRAAPRGETSAAAAAAEPLDVRSGSSEPTAAQDDDPMDEPLVSRCPGCGYTYTVVTGEEREGFAAGTAWSEIPDSWCCPDCGVREKVDFVVGEAAVAG